MYALLSAAASFFLQPLTWLLGLSALVALLRSSRWKFPAAWAALAVALVFTNPWLYHAATNAWEPEPVEMADLDPPYQDAIVLGGFTKLWATPTDRLHLNADGNRFTQAVELYHAGKVGRLLFVSGGLTSSTPVLAEADLAARTARRLGVPETAVVALNTSRNTRENASETRAFYEREGRVPERLLLVTSAFHARRSLATFRSAGLEPALFPTDHRTERDHADRRLSLANTVLPRPSTILYWGPLLREWVGLLVYRLKGWAS